MSPAGEFKFGSLIDSNTLSASQLDVANVSHGALSCDCNCDPCDCNEGDCNCDCNA